MKRINDNMVGSPAWKTLARVVQRQMKCSSDATLAGDADRYAEDGLYDDIEQAILEGQEIEVSGYLTHTGNPVLVSIPDELLMDDDYADED